MATLNKPCHAVLPSAGMGMRLGGDQPKQFRHLAGKPMLFYALDAFFACPEVNSVWIGMSPGSNPLIHDLKSRYPNPVKRFEFLETGGPTRQQTVLNTLAAMLDLGVDPHDWVLVHDAARPGITPELIARLITLVKAQEQAENHHQALQSGGLLAMPVADTMKETTHDAMRAKTTIDRSRLWQAQTPQMFPLKVLHDALDQAIRDGANITDEASAIERLGGQPLLVEGATRNFKVTHPADWDLMELVLSERRQNTVMTTSIPFRIGQGYDIHALVPDRKLILGGVTIPYEKGLLGHSDADALLHAITDALLGAAGLHDIGQMFPDDDARFKDMDSRVLLRAALQKVQAVGYQVGNVDATVICQKPKLASYIPEMVRNIASDLKVTDSHINLKAKTNESLGHLGRGEGIAVHAVALLYKAL